MNAIDIVKEQAEAYDAGKSYAVVTIVHSDGSTPRSSGKMIVYADGTTRGTIGGGAVELAFSLVGIICLWSGLMRVAQAAGLTELLAGLFSPALGKLFKGLKKGGAAMQFITLNLTANLLGLGSAIYGAHAHPLLRQCAGFVKHQTI